MTVLRSEQPHGCPTRTLPTTIQLLRCPLRVASGGRNDYGTTSRWRLSRNIQPRANKPVERKQKPEPVSSTRNRSGLVTDLCDYSILPSIPSSPVVSLRRLELARSASAPHFVPSGRRKEYITKSRQCLSRSERLEIQKSANSPPGCRPSVARHLQAQERSPHILVRKKRFHPTCVTRRPSRSFPFRPLPRAPTNPLARQRTSYHNPTDQKRGRS